MVIKFFISLGTTELSPSTLSTSAPFILKKEEWRPLLLSWTESCTYVPCFAPYSGLQYDRLPEETTLRALCGISLDEWYSIFDGKKESLEVVSIVRYKMLCDPLLFSIVGISFPQYHLHPDCKIDGEETFFL